jgi:uncharacterized protein
MSQRQKGKYETIANLPATLPVFPLPGALLFAREVLPLNVFEPRYLEMMDDVLVGDRMVGIVQPLETDIGAGIPKLQSVGCAARLTGFQETEDDHYLISLKGICRFTLGLEEDPKARAFRTVAADYSAYDFDLKPSQEAGQINRKRLLEVVKEYLDRNNMDVNWDVIHQTPDESLINYFCMVSPYGIRERQALLEAPSLTDRTDMMIALAEMLLAQGQDDDPPVH